jgi:probable HAF family extracellular repeat protein
MSPRKNRSSILPWMVAGAVSTLLGTSLLVAGKPAPPALYAFTDLGGFNGLTSIQSEARAVSNVDGSGLLTIVGNCYTSTAHMDDPAEWTVTAAGRLVGVTDLRAPVNSTVASAIAVNDDGVSVGNVLQTTGITFPGFVSVPGVGTIPLPAFGGLDSGASALNNSGEIVGYADDARGNRWGALWEVDLQGNITGPTNLGTFIPAAINDSGEMAGTQGGFAAIAWFDGAGTLHTQSLGVLSRGDAGSAASAINSFGDVVGGSYSTVVSAGGIVSAYRHAFVWHSDTMTMTALGNLGGGTSSATSINDAGQVVGWSTDQHGATVPFLWKNGTIANLNTLAGLGSGVTAITAASINNSGHIVGMASVSVSRKGSELHGYLLTPKP